MKVVWYKTMVPTCTSPSSGRRLLARRLGRLIIALDLLTAVSRCDTDQAEANLAKDPAAVKLAQANLAKDPAQANYAAMQARRYQRLAEKGIVSKEVYDQMRTNAAALAKVLLAERAAIEDARALVGADRAAVENARLQLSYCFIHVPIDGRSGHLLVYRGNVVKGNESRARFSHRFQELLCTWT